MRDVFAFVTSTEKERTMKTRISRLLVLAGLASVAIAASAPAMAHGGYGHAYYGYGRPRQWPHRLDRRRFDDRRGSRQPTRSLKNRSSKVRLRADFCSGPDPPGIAPYNAAMPAEQPYSGLTPDTVLDALASAGLRGDGRLLALNSYENRVYQVWLEAPAEPQAASVVTKFYRPARWTDAQILEEHAFTGELAEREIPVVAPLVIEGRTLHEFGGFRFAVYPRRGGRTPELEDRDTLEWMGRFIGRIHALGATRPFAERPALDIARFGRETRDWLLEHEFIPADLLDAWRSVVELALAGIARCYERAAE